MKIKEEAAKGAAASLPTKEPVVTPISRAYTPAQPPLKVHDLVMASYGSYSWWPGTIFKVKRKNVHVVFFPKYTSGAVSKTQVKLYKPELGENLTSDAYRGEYETSERAELNVALKEAKYRFENPLTFPQTVETVRPNDIVYAMYTGWLPWPAKVLDLENINERDASGLLAAKRKVHCYFFGENSTSWIEARFVRKFNSANVDCFEGHTSYELFSEAKIEAKEEMKRTFPRKKRRIR